MTKQKRPEMDDRTRARREPVAITELLGAILERVHGGTDARVHRLLTEWRAIAGTRWAERSRPVRVDGGILLVEANSPTDAGLLRYETGELLRRIDGAIGANVVDAVRLRVARRGSRSC